MHKRTKGYTLLLLLVLTGLAGRLSTTTITGQERSFLINNLKGSKTYLFKLVKGLSEEQLNFKNGEDNWSVNDHIQHLTLSEYNYWKLAEKSLKQKANPAKKREIKINDQGLIDLFRVENKNNLECETIKPGESRWNTTSEALYAFKQQRTELIKFAKTTTDDLRNHLAESSIGIIDSYQVLLLLSNHANQHILQIEKIKSNPAFPKK